MNAFGGADTFIGIENLVGSPFNDTLAGDAANNVFIGGLGNDAITGREGLDVAEFTNARIAYAITNAGGRATVTGPQGTDTLEGVERLHFVDSNVALDLNASEAAGNTLRVIGAALDTQHMTRELVGEGIALFDAGLSMLEVSQLAVRTPLFLSLAGSPGKRRFRIYHLSQCRRGIAVGRRA